MGGGGAKNEEIMLILFLFSFDRVFEIVHNDKPQASFIPSYCVH